MINFSQITLGSFLTSVVCCCCATFSCNIGICISSLLIFSFRFAFCFCLRQSITFLLTLLFVILIILSKYWIEYLLANFSLFLFICWITNLNLIEVIICFPWLLITTFSLVPWSTILLAGLLFGFKLFFFKLLLLLLLLLLNHSIKLLGDVPNNAALALTIFNEVACDTQSYV